MTDPVKPLKIAIAIATAGRRDVTTQTINLLAAQSRIADELLICPAREEDFDADCLQSYPGKARIFFGPVGLPAQRNVLLDATDADVLIFFDDDFLPCNDYVAEVEVLFNLHPEVVVTTGKLIADGALGPGIIHEEGLRLLQRAGPNFELRSMMSTYNGYGCNMSIRMKAVRTLDVRFDEHLPLYAWLEDVDFCRQLVSQGTIVQVLRLRGVHLGTKGPSRSPGIRLGYSQVANPVYLARKGTMHWILALKHMSKNLIANSARSFFPEPWVDRRGRFFGNLLALWDWMRGKVDPKRILGF